MFWTVLPIAWLIIFRESLEATLIIAIILAYFAKMKVDQYNRYIWYGVVGASLASISLGCALLYFSMSLRGLLEKLYEGIISLFATLVLTYMIIWMTKNARRVGEELEERLSYYLSKKDMIGITTLAFIAVFREGLEAVLFLSVIANFSILGVFVGAIAGLLSVILIGYFIIFAGYKLPLKRFFKISSIILLIFAAGIFGYGIHEIIEVIEMSGFSLGILAEPLWNTNFLLDEESLLGQILKTLVGYDENPELLRILGYIGYWISLLYYLRRQKLI